MADRFGTMSLFMSLLSLTCLGFCQEQERQKWDALNKKIEQENERKKRMEEERRKKQEEIKKYESHIHTQYFVYL